MKIVGINGSPRKKGNTELLLESALFGASAAGARIEKINLGDLEFSPCLSCFDARLDGVCKLKDDLEKVYKSVYEADGIILASPVYFGSISAQTKMLIDRFQCYWSAVNVHKTIKQKVSRPGLFLCVEASTKQSFFENSRSVVGNFFTTLKVVSEGELLCSGVEGKGEIKKRPECLEKARKMGYDMAVKYNPKGGK